MCGCFSWKACSFGPSQGGRAGGVDDLFRGFGLLDGILSFFSDFVVKVSKKPRQEKLSMRTSSDLPTVYYDRNRDSISGAGEEGGWTRENPSRPAATTPPLHGMWGFDPGLVRYEFDPTLQAYVG